MPPATNNDISDPGFEFEDPYAQHPDDFDRNPADMALGGGGEGSEPPPAFLRDLTEDDVYERINRINDITPQMTALESRLNGGVNSLAERMAAFEKGIPTQSSLDVEAITKGLETYDPKLAEVLGPLLQEAFKTHALDENTLRPHLDPMQDSMRQYVNEQIVMSAYTPEALAEIIPPVKEGGFAPEGQRHKDFIDWYSQQGFETQQSLLSLGVPYVNALRRFEKWEKDLTASRASKASDKESQLDKGRLPASQSRKPAQPKITSAEEAQLAGFNEVFEEQG